MWYFVMLEKQNNYNVHEGGVEQYEESILHTGEHGAWWPHRKCWSKEVEGDIYARC